MLAKAIKNGESILQLVLIMILSLSCRPEVLTENEDAYSIVHGDAYIPNTPYSTIKTELKELEKGYPEYTTYITYGKSVSGEDLVMIRLGNEKIKDFKRQAVSISGATHGNEFLDIVRRLPKWILENKEKSSIKKFFDAGGFIYIVPIINPDGYRQNKRVNDRGVDLNRDFDVIIGQKTIKSNGFSQPETKLWTEKLAAEVKKHSLNLKITMDYHCCVRKGAMLYPWSYNETATLPSKALEETKRYVKIMKNSLTQMIAGRTFDIINYTATGTSKDYFHSKYGSASYTYEGEEYIENDKFKSHTDMWSDLLGDLPVIKEPNSKIDQSGSNDQGASDSATDNNNSSTKNSSSREINIAIDPDSSEPNILKLHFASAPEIVKIKICLGQPQACQSKLNGTEDNMVTLSKSTQKVGRNFYNVQKFNISAFNEPFNLLGLDQSNNLVKMRSVRIEKTALQI